MHLQISEDLDAQRRNWAFERCGWVVLALLLLAALLGLFGPGIFGDTHTSAPNGALSVEHLRFARARSPQQIRIRVEPQVSSEARFDLWLDSTLLEAVTIERITPEPERIVAGAQRTTFEFAWDEEPGVVPITLELTAQQLGRIRGRVGSGAAVVAVRQFVHP